MTPDEIVAIANHCKANLTLEKIGDGGDLTTRVCHCV